MVFGSMKTSATKLGLAILVLGCIGVSAQWLNLPTKNVPRKADGTPDLAAPAPRTADGKPDLSGTWVPEKNKPCPPAGCDDMELIQEFTNIGWSIGSLPYQPWALDLLKSRQAVNGKGDPGSVCAPIGIVKMYTSPFYRKFIQTPGLLIFLLERDTAYRQIFTDGRALPVDPNPTPNGYSTGKWEGDTLVVETTGLSDGQWLDRMGSPLTSAAKITERFRRVNFGRMEIAVTVNDPKAYSKPWTVKLTQNIALNSELIDFFCMENEKDQSHIVGK